MAGFVQRFVSLCVCLCWLGLLTMFFFFTHCSCRYYEIVNSFPQLHYLSQFQSSAPQRSLCPMPKRGLNVGACEIFRFYKLYATKNYVEPISMIAPRKVKYIGPNDSLIDWLNEWKKERWLDWLIVWLIEWLIDWLIDWMNEWLIVDWLIDYSVDWSLAFNIDRLFLFQSGLFHDDLFPDTAAPTPSMTTEEWLNGQNEAPILVSLKVPYKNTMQKGSLCCRMWMWMWMWMWMSTIIVGAFLCDVYLDLPITDAGLTQNE